MAEPYDTLRFNIVSRITDMYSNWNGVVGEANDLKTALQNDGNPQSYTQCSQLAIDLGAVRNNWGGGSSTLGGRLLSMFDYLNGGIGAGDVTMAAILSAMMEATSKEIEEFMGITQAYKVAVWDAPFNEEFYAALARGFKTWGP
jgi:hypothetical protein